MYQRSRRRRSRRVKHEEESHERWLVSYADFITLLFAFFVILYATSSKNSEKEKQFEDSVRQYLAKAGGTSAILVGGEGGAGNKSEGLNKSPLDSLLTNPLDNYKVQDPGVSSLLKKIEIFVEENFTPNQITQYIQDINANEKGVRIVLYGSQLFQGQGAELNPEALFMVEKLSRVLKQEVVKIIVEAHLSQRFKLEKGRYGNLWELGAVRATTMANYLVTHQNFVADNIIPISYGSIRPRFSPNEEGPKQKNTRLTLYVVDAEVDL